jgi:hypothetical protein
MDLTNCHDISTQSDLALEVCTFYGAGKNVVSDLPHAFECCWQTCEQTFSGLQIYFNHVETHVYCNPCSRKVEGGVPCHCMVSSNFHSMNSHHNLY